MTARRLIKTDLTICNKCGNVMITRKIRTNNSEVHEFETVHQCIVCRFWKSVN